MGKKEFLNMKEYAAYKMVSADSVRKAIESGKITSWSRAGRGWNIHVEKADAEWAAAYDPNYRRENAAGEDTAKTITSKELPAGLDAPTITQSKQLKEQYAAELKKIEYEEKMGTLVSKDAVYKALFEMGKELRQEFQTLADRVVDDVLAQRTRFDSHRVLSEAINLTLERLTEIENRELK
jgi:hypothetical protein